MLLLTKNFLNRPILKEMSWYTLGQFFIQIFTFLGVLLTSRYFGPTNLGIYSFVQNYLLVFSTVLTGLDVYFTWNIAKSDNKISELKKFTGHKIIIASFITCFGIGLAWMLLQYDVALYATIVFIPFVLGSVSGFSVYAVVTQQAKRVAFFQILASGAAFLAKATLVFLKAPLLSFVIVSSIEGVLFAVIIFFSFIKNKSIRLEFSKTPFPTLQSTFSVLWSIKMHVIVLILWQLILRVDQLILAAISNAHTLGIYVSAVKIAEIPNFFISILHISLVSRIASFVRNNEEGSHKSLNIIFRTYLLSGIFAALVIIVFAPFLIHLLYGDSFKEAVPILQVYALSIPGMFLCVHYFSIYSATQRQFKQSVVYIFGLIINISLIILLYPHFGSAGVSLATVVAYSTMAALLYSNRFLDSKD